MHAEVVYIDYRLEVIEAKEIYQSVIHPRHLHQNNKYLHHHPFSLQNKIIHFTGSQAS